jgi:hypothetical protein
MCQLDSHGEPEADAEAEAAVADAGRARQGSAIHIIQPLLSTTIPSWCRLYCVDVKPNKEWLVSQPCAALDITTTPIIYRTSQLPPIATSRTSTPW